MTHLVLIGLGVLIAVLTAVSCFGLLPSLRIVPDNTHFDFTRFRRISFPISAVLSKGLRTKDIAAEGEATISTSEMGDAIVAALKEAK